MAGDVESSVAMNLLSNDRSAAVLRERDKLVADLSELIRLSTISQLRQSKHFGRLCCFHDYNG